MIIDICSDQYLSMNELEGNTLLMNFEMTAVSIMPSAVVVPFRSLFVFVHFGLFVPITIVHFDLDVFLGLQRGHLVNHVLGELHPIVAL